mmetsp:Transcript_22024/g.46355  ORF Transcript_22024/g.46355 Transcript_22024/m.46355 type:complete len:226 (-) Transcript_22024:98-775(-)
MSVVATSIQNQSSWSSSSSSFNPISFLGSINTSNTRSKIAPPRIEVTTASILFLLANKKLRYKCAHAIFPTTIRNGRRTPALPPAMPPPAAIPMSGATNAILQNTCAASPKTMPPTHSSAKRDVRETNFAKLRCRRKESAFRHASEVRRTLMTASRTERIADCIVWRSRVRVDRREEAEEASARARTSEATHRRERTSRRRMGARTRTGTMVPPRDWVRYQGGEF